MVKRRRYKSNSNRRYYKRRRKKNNRLLLAVIGVFAVIMLITFISILSYGKVYSGILLNGNNVSGMSRDKLEQHIEETYNRPMVSSNYQISFLNKTWAVDPDELNIKYNKDNICDVVLSVGREGSIFSRIGKIFAIRFSPVNIDLSNTFDSVELISFDKDVMSNLVSSILDYINPIAIEHSVVKLRDGVNIISGFPGYDVSQEKLESAILEMIMDESSNSLDVVTLCKVTYPKDLDVEAVFNEVYIAPKDAVYIKSGGGASVSPHSAGKTVDRDSLTNTLSKLSGEYSKSHYLPYKTVQPKITTEQLKKPEFNETISSKSTKFSASDKNRNHNIGLAGSTINGYVLLPGEIFSFNRFVGDTTEAKGYLPAPGFGYADGLTYGGGVCQVSTTLYLSAIYGGVEIVKRSPHSYPVSYAHKGLDAAIAFDYKDLQIKNNFSAPIKIVCEMKSNSITFKIMGIKENKNITYEFEPVQIGDPVPFATEYTTDKKKAQKGSIGYKFETYRITYVDGVETKRELFNKSTYLVKNEIIYKP